LEIFDARGKKVRLPKAEVLVLDSKKKFQATVSGWDACHSKEQFSRLRPLEWKQGGFDAVYIDSNTRSFFNSIRAS
jgi:hypothetical protein